MTTPHSQTDRPAPTTIENYVAIWYGCGVHPWASWAFIGLWGLIAAIPGDKHILPLAAMYGILIIRLAQPHLQILLLPNEQFPARIANTLRHMNNGIPADSHRLEWMRAAVRSTGFFTIYVRDPLAGCSTGLWILAIAFAFRSQPDDSSTLTAIAACGATFLMSTVLTVASFRRMRAEVRRIVAEH